MSGWSEMGGSKAGKSLPAQTPTSSIGKRASSKPTTTTRPFVQGLPGRYLSSLIRILGAPVKAWHRQPANCSLASGGAQEDGTIIRPLVMDFREDATARRAVDQYMFGPASSSNGDELENA